MEKLTQNILALAAQQPEGVSISARELLHLGSRVAVDQSLSRLVRSGRLMRVGRGLYVRPVETRFGRRPPAVETVIAALAEAKGEIVVSHGAAAANALGLTTQVPARSVYLTSGRSRKLTLGTQTVELRHAPAWQLALSNHPAGEAVRALAWFGKSNADTVLASLQKRLPKGAIAELMNARAQLPTWLAERVSQMAIDG